MKHAKQYFDNHKSVNKLFFTSDGLAFFDEHNANAHAEHLDDKTIKPRTREEIDKELEQLSNSGWDEDLEYDPLDELDAE